MKLLRIRILGKFEKMGGWLPYVKNDAISTAFAFARYSKVMEKTKQYGMKYRQTSHFSPMKFSNSLGNESDEPNYTYNDKY